MRHVANHQLDGQSTTEAQASQEVTLTPTTFSRPPADRPAHEPSHNGPAYPREPPFAPSQRDHRADRQCFCFSESQERTLIGCPLPPAPPPAPARRVPPRAQRRAAGAFLYNANRENQLQSGHKTATIITSYVGWCRLDAPQADCGGLRAGGALRPTGMCPLWCLSLCKSLTARRRPPGLIS
jgi:hypothetical protein